MKVDEKPLPAKSPIRLRPRWALHSNNASSLQTPPVFARKVQSVNGFEDIEEPGLPARAEYHTISTQLQALAEMVKDEFGYPKNFKFGNTLGGNSSPMFVRGRFYDEYSARRNERLKRKKGEIGDEPKTAYSLGVKLESVKRKDMKKFGSLRKSVPANFSVNQNEKTRYSLRSSKENKIPSLPLNFENSVQRNPNSIAKSRYSLRTSTELKKPPLPPSFESSVLRDRNITVRKSRRS